MDEITILIIEDDTDINMMLQKLLSLKISGKA